MLRLINEETIKPVAAEEVEEITSPEINEIPEEVVTNACQDLVNGLIQNAWNFISEINSTIATIDYDFKNEITKKEVKEILNQIVDDTTINIGMLHKAFELINVDKATLLTSGEEKAEQIISNE